MWLFLFSFLAIGLGVYEFRKLKKLLTISKTTNIPYAGFGLWQGYIFGGTLIFIGVVGIISCILEAIT